MGHKRAWFVTPPLCVPLACLPPLQRLKEVERKKAEGNDAFQANDYAKAIECYTGACMRAGAKGRAGGQPPKARIAG